MSTTTLKGPCKIPANNKPDKLVIFLHGLGSNGHDLMGLTDEIAEILPNAAFFSPNAPFPYNAYPSSGYQWFSLADSNPNKIYEGIKIALPILQCFVNENLNKFHLEYRDLILVGFSQGTMMALQLAPRLEKECYVIGFAGAVIKPEILQNEMKSKPDVCLIHGELDQVVPISQHSLNLKALESMDLPISQCVIKELGHSINDKALEYAKNYLKQKLCLLI